MVKKEYEINIYACLSNNQEKQLNSSSGGIFPEIAEVFIKDGGVVFGAAWDENFNVKHIMINRVEEIQKLQGSKYVQSNLGDTFRTIKKILNDEIPVLFSGTPCQVAGLKKFIGNNDKLYLIDFICHGVPSQYAWNKYLEDRNINIDKLININMRDKQIDWHNYGLKLYYGDNIEYYSKQEDYYLKAFLSDYMLRNSCYNCKFNNIEHKYSDLTLGDFWGIWDIIPEKFDSKGISLIISQNNRGEILLDRINNNIQKSEIDKDIINLICEHNNSLIKNVKMPKARVKFYKYLYNGKSFKYAVDRSSKTNLIGNIKNIIKKILKK